jgi:hypothetical protein
MGAFLGSIHVRTNDREVVRAALEKLARKKKACFLLAPSLRGWTSIYPSEHGQDDSVSRSLAKALPYDLIHVLVHDDDVFAYYVYRSGKLLDEYNSAPDYFEPVSARKKARVAGRPELLAELLKDPGAVFELRRILDEHRIFATETLERFAALFDLPNAATSYEYLLGGETDGIEDFDQFVRVPEVSDEDRRQAQETPSFEDARRGFLEQGLLLAELAAPSARQWRPFPVWCTRPSEGFLLCWSPRDLGAQPTQIPLLHWTSPWSEEISPLGIQVDSRAHAMTASPSGRFLAIGFASGQWSTQLWDLEGRALIAAIPASRAVESLAFNLDEQLVAFRSQNQVVLVETGTGKPIVTANVAGGQSVALHPSGKYAVTDHPDGLAVIEIPSGRLISTLGIGAVHDMSATREHLLTQMRSQMGKLESHLAKMQPQLDQFDAESRKRFEEYIEQYKRSVETGDLPGWLGTGKQSAEQACRMAFTPDGEEFFLATNAGARVYAWKALLAARECTPPPRVAADAEQVACERHGQVVTTLSHTYGLAHDSARNLLLFCGLEGKVRAVDLADRRVADLTPRLGPGGLLSLALSSDRSVLCTQAVPAAFEQPRDAASALRIWDYPRLLESCALGTQ